jgi:hypothetical protein
LYWQIIGTEQKDMWRILNIFITIFFFQLYGGTCSSILLTAFSKLFTAFLQRHGFSLGVEDILVVKDADEQRFKFITRARKVSDVG